MTGDRVATAAAKSVYRKPVGDDDDDDELVSKLVIRRIKR